MLMHYNIYVLCGKEYLYLLKILLKQHFHKTLAIISVYYYKSPFCHGILIFHLCLRYNNKTHRTKYSAFPFRKFMFCSYVITYFIRIFAHLVFQQAIRQRYRSDFNVIQYSAESSAFILNSHSEMNSCYIASETDIEFQFVKLFCEN